MVDLQQIREIPLCKLIFKNVTEFYTNLLKICARRFQPMFYLISTFERNSQISYSQKTFQVNVFISFSARNRSGWIISAYVKNATGECGGDNFAAFVGMFTLRMITTRR